LSEARTEARRARRARSVAVFVHPLEAAIEATRSALVKAYLPSLGEDRERMLAEVASEGQGRSGAVSGVVGDEAATRDRDMVGDAVKKVRLFTLEGNADGEAALAFLQARGAAVDVRDVGRDPDASLELFNRLGRMGVPAIAIDDRVFVGFGVNRDEIEALLRE